MRASGSTDVLPHCSTDAEAVARATVSNNNMTNNMYEPPRVYPFSALLPPDRTREKRDRASKSRGFIPSAKA